MNIKTKDFIIMLTIFIVSYLFIPLIILNYIDVNEINKVGFFIILLISFLSFSYNIIYSYIRGNNIIIPILSIVISILLIFIFNKSAIIIVIIVSLLSFLGYYLGNIFTKSK